MTTPRLLSFIVCLLVAGLSSSQTDNFARPPHGLVVLDLSLTMEVHPPQSRVPLTDSVAVPSRRDNPHQDPIDKMRGPSPVPVSSPAQGKQPNLNVYVYSLKLRNEGAKNVRGVLWEYVAADLDSRTELNRRRFKSIEDINHGKTVTLRATSLSPPTNVVTQGGLGKDQLSRFRSSVDIRCVLYADGSAWEADGKKPDCDELRQAESDARKTKH